MSDQSYNAKIGDLRLMVSGIHNHQEALSKRGIDAAFVEKLEELKQQAEQLDNEQEKLKTELKKKTVAIEAIFDEAMKMHSEAKKMVKATIPQIEWGNFGITDKK